MGYPVQFDLSPRSQYPGHSPDLQGPPNFVIRDIRFDSYHRCWISTWGNGIYLVDLGKNRWTPFSPSNIRTVVYGGAEWRLESQPWMVFACSFPCIFLVNEKDLSTRTILFDSTTMAFSRAAIRRPAEYPLASHVGRRLLLLFLQ